LLLATALVKLIGAFFKIPISSNYCLGDLGFGYFSSAYDFFSPVYTITVSGFPVAISRVVADFTARNRFKDAKNAFKASKWLLFALGLAASLLMVALAFPFVRITDTTGKSLYSLLAIAPSFVFCFWSSAYRGYFEGLHNMTYPAVSNVIEALGKLILGLGFAVATVQLTGNAALAAATSLLGITVGNIIGALYLKIIYKGKSTLLEGQALEDTPLPKKEILKLIIIVSVPIVLSSMSGSMVALVDALTVRWQLTALVSKHTELLKGLFAECLSDITILGDRTLTAEELPTFLYGIRSKAYTIYNLVPSITVALGVSAIPVLAESFAKGAKTQVGKSAGVVLKLSSLITLPIAAGFLAVGEGIMSLLYGGGISSQIGGKMLSLYGIAVAFSGIFIPLSCVLQALGKQNAALYNVGFGVAVKIILNLLLCNIPDVNVFGAVVSTIACNLIIFILHFITLIKCIGLSFQIKNTFIKPLISSACCGITAFLISLSGDSSLITLIAIIGAAVVYLAIASLLNTFCDDDILSLPGGKKLLKICKKVKIVR